MECADSSALFARAPQRWAESSDQWVRLWFEDRGIGIEKDAQERIFQMFQRVDRSEKYEGTGIGLAIVCKAVERMGGRIGVESAPGHGSRFWIELRPAGDRQALHDSVG